MGIKQRKWQEHLKAAETSGMRLSAYAAQHDINVRRLYEERHYVARAKAARARQRRSTFVPVKLKAQSLVKVAPAAHHGHAPGARLAMQARLDNGVVLSWTYDATSASAQANLLHTLAGLPCFS
ncbi:MAG TPA: hypothetical protein VFN09_03090 [Rhodanobacteraceae bacterium]|jgi:hypothetical protein|nr:hypothetical protein [Rhodanobacteraceae bacterium]HQC86461.1 hypothetical protein [Rhodoferax sp.]